MAARAGWPRAAGGAWVREAELGGAVEGGEKDDGRRARAGGGDDPLPCVRSGVAAGWLRVRGCCVGDGCGLGFGGWMGRLAVWAGLPSSKSLDRKSVV